MPKVKDLGVTVVPEGFGPVGIGGGAACGYTVTNPYINPCQLGTAMFTFCVGCTQIPYGHAASFCVATPGLAQQQTCTDCTTQAYSICGTTPGRGGCTDCTTQAYSICGTTPGFGQQMCTDCTTQAYSICGTTPGGGGQCTDCTTQAYSICGTTPNAGGGGKCSDCTTQAYSICGTTPQRPPQPGLTQEAIRQLRAHLEAQLAALDVHEKSLGPKTDAEFAAREKQLQDELDQIRNRQK